MPCGALRIRVPQSEGKLLAQIEARGTCHQTRFRGQCRGNGSGGAGIAGAGTGSIRGQATHATGLIPAPRYSRINPNKAYR